VEKYGGDKMEIERVLLKSINYLPIGKFLGAKSAARLIKWKYDSRIRALRKCGDVKSVAQMLKDRDWELALIEAELKASETDRLVKKAQRKNVEYPKMPKWNDELEEYEPNDFWEFGYERPYLTAEGMAKVKEALRKEAKLAKTLQSIAWIVGIIVGLLTILRFFGIL